MYDEMVVRFINMGTKQFLKDLRREHEVQTTAAHRQQIMLRQKKKRETSC